MKRVFIDGKAGTTGLRIYERLEERTDIELITLSEADRKDLEKRKIALNSADIAFLCLPDDAAKEAVTMIENPDTVVLDTSTAFRTHSDWIYGFPELSNDFRKKIAVSKRISIPGCHASGFIALVYPLIEAGLIKKEACLTCTSLTGYSGGGKKMISQYEDLNRDKLLNSPKEYGLNQNHKHLKEMREITGLTLSPVFLPIVSDYYSGMEVTVPLFAGQVNGNIDDIKNIYAHKYTGKIIHAVECDDSMGYGNKSANLDTMSVTVAGNNERILLMASYDNLGKGASGAAIQCLNIVLGTDETAGLKLSEV